MHGLAERGSSVLFPAGLGRHGQLRIRQRLSGHQPRELPLVFRDRIERRWVQVFTGASAL